MNTDNIRWHMSNRRFTREQRDSRRPKNPDKLVVSYQIRVMAGARVVKELDSAFELPEVRDRGYLAGAATDFPQVFDLLVAKPLAVAVAAYQTEQADACQEAAGRSGASRQNAENREPEVQFRAPQVPNDFPEVLPQPPPANK